MSEAGLVPVEPAPRNEIAAVVLAGGFGTRIRHLLGDLPKPMISVAGRPFLEWVVLHLALQGVRKVVLSTGYRAEAVERHFSRNSIDGVDVDWVREDRPMGTAGGFLHAIKKARFSGAVWIVANGDSLALASLQHVMSRALAKPASGVMLGVAVPDAARYGSLEVASDGTLMRFSEKRPGAGMINAGVYAFPHELLKEIPTTCPLSFETDVFPAWLKRGIPIDVVSCDAPFIDIGTEESLGLADNFIRDHADWFQRD